MTKLIIMYNPPEGPPYPLTIHPPPRSAQARIDMLVASGYERHRLTTVAAEEMP
jgi:hypothetical protein